MQLSALDALLFKAINSGLNVPFLDPVMVFITKYNPIVFLALFLLFYRSEGKRAFVVLLIALVSFGLADRTGSILKDIFMRPRPCHSLQGIILLVKCRGVSMPSNHSANSFAVALPFVMLSRGRVRWAFLGFAAIVAYSRVYVGVHYPGDILVGSALGTVIGLGTSYIYLHFKGKKQPEDTAALESTDQTPDP